jgi:hypothetical protein
MKFKASVEGTPDLSACLPQKGLQALSSHSSHVTDYDSRSLEGSLNLDSCLKASHPDSHRWDYVFGYRGQVWFLEVHDAVGGHSDVIKKAIWLREWLRGKANMLAKLPKGGNRFFWSPTRGVRTIDKYDRQLAQHGIVRVRVLRLNQIMRNSV